MSAQAREEQARRSSTLEGEASGPNYGAASTERPAVTSEPLLNGTVREPAVLDPSSSSSTPGTLEVPLQRATGPVQRASTTSPATVQGIGSREGVARTQHVPTAPQQPQQRQPQLEAATDSGPQPQRSTPATTSQQPRTETPTVSELVQQRAHESLLQHGTVEQVELRREMTVEHGQRPELPDLPGSPERQGQRAPTWWTRVSEVLQRRVVSPVLEQVQSAGVPRLSTAEASPTSVWHSQPATPTEHAQPLMSHDLRQAMTSWTSRPSLLTPRPRRTAGEESSSGSINQEAVAEEVKRQVQLALSERESATRRLEEENQQLRELVMQMMEAGNPVDQGGNAARADGPSAPPRQSGNGDGEGLEPPRALRDPSRLPLQSQVLGGQGGSDQVRAPNGLPVQSQVLGGQGGSDQVRAPSGLPVQSQVLGGQGGSDQVRAPSGLPVQSQVLGGQGGSDRVRAPDGLPVQSQVQGGQGGMGHDHSMPGSAAQPRSSDGEEHKDPLSSRACVNVAQASGNPEERGSSHVDGHKFSQEPRGVDHEAGGTFTEKGVEGQNQPKVVADEDAMVGHLHLLVQGMRQLQQLQISKKDTPETETMKGNIELPPMPELGDAAVEFNDWLYVAEQMLGALTDSASVWLSESLRCAREAYDRYQRASAMDRLTITPALTATLLDKKWYRLERRVLTLLLAAMPKGVKEDTITHRVENVTSVLYRLHVLYQPGGAVERTSILGHLEGSSGTEDPTEVVTRLRKWRRYLARAGEMGIVAPDASILLKGLDLILQKVLERFSDVKFRLDLARNDLRLSSAPTQESVLKYYQHALAELQQMAPSPKKQNETSKLKGAALSGAGTGGSSSTPSSPARTKGPCKFFASDNGCKRGSTCPYTHEFASKAERKQRCWTCGATTHRQGDCPTTGGQGPKGKGKTSSSTSTATANAGATTSSPMVKAQTVGADQHSQASTADNKDATPTPSTTTSSASTTNVDSAAAHREEMRQLLQEANSMLSKIKLMGMKVEGVSRTSEDLELLSRANGMVEQGMALLDSGASHPFRNAVDERELLQASDVNVELADGQTVGLLQTKSGTLLNDKGPSQSPIVPLGSLVQQLGCTVSWSKRQGMKIHHPAHGDLTVKMKGNCPMIDELQALKLISEIEEKNLSRLREATAKSLWSQCTTMGSTWEVSLDNFVVTGERSQALAAMMDKNFPLSLETASERFSMVGPNNLDLSEAAGWNYLKALPVNRKMRRRLHSTRWIVHLYDGKNPITTAQLKQLEDESTTLIEIDLQRSKAYDMKGWSNIFRALLWAACRGQIGGIVGGPPRHDRDELKRKMMYLWMVADRGASKDGLLQTLCVYGAPRNQWLVEDGRLDQDQERVPAVQRKGGQ